MTNYPFNIPESLRQSLPPPRTDGLRYADVQFRDTWDGILVVDSNFQCIGVNVNRRVEQHPLPFGPDEIQDFRKPCFSNRILAALPLWFDIWLASLTGILIVSPVLLAASWAFTPWICLVVFPVVVLSWMGMYSISGFPLIRLPVAVAGLCMMTTALLRLVRHIAESG